MFPQIFGKFVLEREIAAGGMARVYLATLRGAVGFEKKLVVKQIRAELASDEAFVGRFVEEAKTAVELGHPNIVPVYELGVEQGVYYIAMEYCQGATLAEILAETGPLDPEEGAQVGVEMCRALDYAHRRGGIVHRDVTPRNVLIDEEGAVRIIDFGIAAPAARNDDSGARSLEVFGSPGHMPPEQLHGRRLTPATDVFAVAVALVEAWTGKPPFRRATPGESERALGERPALLSEHDPRLAPLDELVASAMALDSGARPASAESLARPLREFLRGAELGDVARRLGARAQQAREHARHRAGGANDAPVARSSGQTLTFAARDELVEWTRPRADMALSTRRLDAADEDSVRAPPSAVDVERRDRAASGWRLLAAALAGMVIAGLVSVRLLERPSGGDTARVAAAAPVRSAAQVAPAAPSGAASPLPVTAPPPSLPAEPALRPSAVPRVPANAPRLAGADPGTLSLTANPPARVTVGGKTYQTPASVQLRPGSYRVVFDSPLLGESTQARVTLEAGESHGIHADFTGSRPSVSSR